MTTSTPVDPELTRLREENDRLRRILRLALGITSDVIGDLSRIATLRDAVLDEIRAASVHERPTQPEIEVDVDEPSRGDAFEPLIGERP
jgi:hypothetical protein